MSDDLKYAIRIVNMVASSFIALVVSILGMIGVAIFEDPMWLAVLSGLVIGSFLGVMIGTIALVREVAFKRGDDK